MVLLFAVVHSSCATQNLSLVRFVQTSQHFSHMDKNHASSLKKITTKTSCNTFFYGKMLPAGLRQTYHSQSHLAPIQAQRRFLPIRVHKCCSTSLPFMCVYTYISHLLISLGYKLIHSYNYISWCVLKFSNQRLQFLQLQST